MIREIHGTISSVPQPRHHATPASHCDEASDGHLQLQKDSSSRKAAVLNSGS